MMLQENIFRVLHFRQLLFYIIVKIFSPVWSVISVSFVAIFRVNTESLVVELEIVALLEQFEKILHRTRFRIVVSSCEIN